jgi:L,D-peptidoglycan transpeptidase YkuD (ErfK/YbiS/YcfS/YnhG family)
MHILIKKKNLIFKDYRLKCALGKRGIGEKKKEGDSITPIGLFKIKYIFYRKDRIKNLKTVLKKKIIKKNQGWCNDSRSEKYNKLIKYPFNFNSEKLYRKDNVYDIIMVLNYNMNPIRKKKGSAIFIHIAKKNYAKTEGCVAIKKKEMIKLIARIKKNTQIKIT